MPYVHLLDGAENIPVVCDTTEPSFWMQVRSWGWSPKTNIAHSGIQIDRVKGALCSLKIENIFSFLTHQILVSVGLRSDNMYKYKRQVHKYAAKDCQPEYCTDIEAENPASRYHNF